MSRSYGQPSKSDRPLSSGERGDGGLIVLELSPRACGIVICLPELMVARSNLRLQDIFDLF